MKLDEIHRQSKIPKYMIQDNFVTHCGNSSVFLLAYNTNADLL